MHIVSKKSNIQVVKNDKNELIPMRLQTGWRMCIDCRKLNLVTQNDHFPLPFIDEMLERLARNNFFCFLDGYSWYMQIWVAQEDQDKTMFTYPFGTFAYRRIPSDFVMLRACSNDAWWTSFQICWRITSRSLYMDDFIVYSKSLDIYLGT